MSISIVGLRRDRQVQCRHTNRAVVLIVTLTIALLAMGCSSATQFSNTGATPQSHSGNNSASSVDVFPAESSMASGETLRFWATVKNSADTAVTWSSNLGSISSQGLFIAPKVASPQVATVIARTKTGVGSTTVTVQPQSKKSSLQIVTQNLLNANSGTPYQATLLATGGSAPYRWSISQGSLPTGLALDASTGTVAGSTSQTGTYSLTAKAVDATSASASASLSLTVSAASNFDGPAELPRVYMQSAMADTPSSEKIIHVNAGGDLQAAINQANCGDTIALQANATFAGLFTLPAKSCDDAHWILIRTDAPDASLPAEGTRLTPCYAGVASLPGRPPFHCASTQRVVPQIIYPQTAGCGPFLVAAGANHYRLMGLEITRSVGTGFIGHLVGVKAGTTANNIIVDRSWLHGTANDETSVGVSLSGMNYVSVVDSFFTDFHCTSMVGACTDGHAVSGGLGTVAGGPYKVVNNFLEAGGENILFGGGAATTTPGDIEIRLNHLFKPLIWMPGQPGFVGGKGGYPFMVKNHFELKNAQRVLFEGNILENTWGGFSQHGMSILLTPKNQYQSSTNSYLCPICEVTDVTIRYNTISHVAGGFEIGTGLSGYGNGLPAYMGARYSIHDVTIDDIDPVKYRGDGGLASLGNHWPTNVLNSVSFNHVTAFPVNHLMSIGDYAGEPKMWGFNFTNSIVIAGRYSIWSTGGGTANCAYYDTPLRTFNACFTTYTFTKNALIAPSAALPLSSWPAGNMFPASVSAVGFVNFNNGNGGDYHLLASSPYKNKGTDGKDLGADIDAIQALIAGVY